MHRIRRLALVVAVLATSLVAGPAGGTAHPRAVAAVRTVTVGYGDGPVRSTAARVLKVAFEAEKGDRVRLATRTLVSKGTGPQCPHVTLRRRGVDLGPPDIGGYWRVPTGDRYVFKVWNPPRCSDTLAVRAQLVKLRVRTVGLGEQLRLPDDERGFAWGARVGVPDHGQAMVRTTAQRRWTQDQGHVVVHGQPAGHGFFRGPDSLTVEGYPVTIPNLLLQAGQPMRYLHPYFRTDDVQDSPEALPGGKRVLVLPVGDVKVTVTRPDLTATQVDGPGVTVTAEPRGKALTVASFATAVPQWLRLQLTVDGVVQHRLGWGAGGVEVSTSVNTSGVGDRVLAPFGDLVRVPAGRHHLRVFTRTTDDTRARVTVHLVAVRTLPALPTDGTRVELATTAPGEWVLAPVELDPAHTYRADASDVVTSRAQGWTGHVHPAQRVRCRDVFCSAPVASFQDDRLSATGLKVVEPGGVNPWFALFAPHPDVTGRVTYTITPTT